MSSQNQSKGSPGGETAGRGAQSGESSEIRSGDEVTQRNLAQQEATDQILWSVAERNTGLGSLAGASEIRPTTKTRGALLLQLMPIRSPSGNGDQLYWLDA
jgi:hypothetical protein